MKIKDGFVLKTVAGSRIIVPVSKPNFHSIMTLNETGAFLFEKLGEQTDIDSLADLLVDTFEVDKKTAYDDVVLFLQSLDKAGLLDE